MITSMTLQERLRYSFQNPTLLEQALTHRSYKNENRTTDCNDNERLEFLGDAVLSLALSQLLLNRYTSETEGQISKRRASLVNEATLSEIALSLGIPELLRLGRGEQLSGGSVKPRLVGSALEALLGAIFLDSNYETAQAVVALLFDERLSSDKPTREFEKDYKTRLQEWAQAQYGEAPLYALVMEQGPEHEKIFSVEVSIAGQVRGRGQGKTKKQAEQEAAHNVLLEVIDESKS